MAEENGIQIASLLDLLASKLKTIQSRAAAKNYRDILAMFERRSLEKLQWSFKPQSANVL